MTNYYKDKYECYYSTSKIKELITKVRKNTTVDLGGLIFGAIGLAMMI